MDPSATPCYDKAMELLARRSHFRRQLESKLLTRGYSAGVVEETLDRLGEAGYLDDARTAAEWVEMRLARAPEGRRRLRAELVRRGAPDEAIDAALAACVPSDELPAVRRAAESFRRRRDDEDALVRHLQRKGFTDRSILTVLAEVRSERAAADASGGDRSH